MERSAGGIAEAIATGALTDNLFGPGLEGMILCGFQTLEKNLDKQEKIFLFVVVVGRWSGGDVVVHAVVRI